MALYHQLKFQSTFIEYRSVSEWKRVVVISNFDSLEAAPSIYRPRQLPSLPRPKFAPGSSCKVPDILSQIVMQLELSRQFVKKSSNIKFNENPSSVSQRTDRQDEANSRFTKCCERA